MDFEDHPYCMKSEIAPPLYYYVPVGYWDFIIFWILDKKRRPPIGFPYACINGLSYPIV